MLNIMEYTIIEESLVEKIENSIKDYNSILPVISHLEYAGLHIIPCGKDGFIISSSKKKEACYMHRDLRISPISL